MSAIHRMLLPLLLAVTTLLSITCSEAIAQPKFCPAIIDYVCGLTSAKQLQTFQNNCKAEQAGATVLHHGQCYGQFCPHDVLPPGGVCAKSTTTGALKHYDNLCWAEKDFAVFVNNGPCP